MDTNEILKTLQSFNLPKCQVYVLLALLGQQRRAAYNEGYTAALTELQHACKKVPPPPQIDDPEDQYEGWDEF